MLKDCFLKLSLYLLQRVQTYLHELQYEKALSAQDMALSTQMMGQPQALLQVGYSLFFSMRTIGIRT